MEFSAKQIAELLGGIVDGNKEIKVSNLSKIEEGKSGTLSFLANPAYTHYIYNTHASIVIVNKDFVPESPVSSTLIRVDNAYESFAKLLEIYNEIKHNISGISKLSSIAENAKIGNNVFVGDFVVISDNVTVGDNVKIYAHSYIGNNSKIGFNTILFSGVKVYSDNTIGNNCTIHSGVIIGADGFGFAHGCDNNYKKVAQIGNVIIEDNVEIGSNTTIDRATLGSTIIRKGVKLDNLIQIAHNVEIGENTVIAAQAGIAGSSKIGKNCMIGGQVGISGHLKIGDNVKIAAQSGIGSNISDNSIIQGSPAFSVLDYQRSYVHFRRLPDIVKRIDKIEKKIV